MHSILTLTLNITLTLTLILTLNALDSNHNSNPNVLDYHTNSKSSISTLTPRLNALYSNPLGNPDPNPNLALHSTKANLTHNSTPNTILKCTGF